MNKTMSPKNEKLAFPDHYLTLFRHGHKGATPIIDPELSIAGLLQAQKLLDHVKQQLIPLPTKAFSSNKVRTFQTLEAVCIEQNILINKTSQLNHRSNDETAIQFSARIKSFIDNLTQEFKKNNSMQSIFICSHFDWIEEVLIFLPSQTDLTSFGLSQWAPGQFIVFKVSNGVWTIENKGVL